MQRPGRTGKNMSTTPTKWRMTRHSRELCFSSVEQGPDGMSPGCEVVQFAMTAFRIERRGGAAPLVGLSYGIMDCEGGLLALTLERLDEILEFDVSAHKAAPPEQSRPANVSTPLPPPPPPAKRKATGGKPPTERKRKRVSTKGRLPASVSAPPPPPLPAKREATGGKPPTERKRKRVSTKGRLPASVSAPPPPPLPAKREATGGELPAATALTFKALTTRADYEHLFSSSSQAARVRHREAARSIRHARLANVTS